MSAFAIIPVSKLEIAVSASDAPPAECRNKLAEVGDCLSLIPLKSALCSFRAKRHDLDISLLLTDG